MVPCVTPNMKMQLGNVREDAMKNVDEDNSECEDVYEYATWSCNSDRMNSFEHQTKRLFFPHCALTG